MRRPNRLSPRPPGAAATAVESGSAYIVVLLVLVVLTILGLALVLVTQTERQIGSSEKTVERLSATADSGVALAVAKRMVLIDPLPMKLELREPRQRLDGTEDPTLANKGLFLRHDLETSAFHPILDAPCHLCEVNTGGSADVVYKSINHALASTATRRGWAGSDSDDATSFGRQGVVAMVQIQPAEGVSDPLFQAGYLGAQVTYKAGRTGMEKAFCPTCNPNPEPLPEPEP